MNQDSSEDLTLKSKTWTLLAHDLFFKTVEPLIQEVETLKQKDPENYRDNFSAKFLAAIFRIMLNIARDPTISEYRQGNTLGAKFKHWFRAKFLQRYRLFFQYRTSDRNIIYVWVNDARTLRSTGSSTDVYHVFRKKLNSGFPPNDWNELKKATQAVPPSWFKI